MVIPESYTPIDWELYIELLKERTKYINPLTVPIYIFIGIIIYLIKTEK
jgi:hypothetical protein